MAKRRRLGPAVLSGTETIPAIDAPAPPIARVAGEAAAEAAVLELSDEISRARAEGRMVQEISINDIDDSYLSRDRLVTDPSELAALEASIAARGQQMPIELVDKGVSNAPRYGLISGWRRLSAIRRLVQGDPGHPATVRAVLRRPEGAADAYLSMVEENELRVGLSYYERAQVAAKSADLGVFETVSAAVQGLFPTASKAKRSKINAFIRIFRSLDDVLRFPEAIPERLGLRLAKVLDEGGAPELTDQLRSQPAASAEDEKALIERLLAPKTETKSAQSAPKTVFSGGVELVQSKGALTLKGKGVDRALLNDLTTWLRARQEASS